MYLFLTMLIVSMAIGLLFLIATEGEEAGFGVIIFLLFLFIGVLVSDEETTITETTYRDIVTLKDNSSISGGFFLGCGSIDGSMRYAFYCKTDNDSFKFRSIDCNDVELIYSADDPQLIIATTKSDPNCRRNKWRMNFLTESKEYFIKIPHGSIKTGFVLDAQ